MYNPLSIEAPNFVSALAMSLLIFAAVGVVLIAKHVSMMALVIFPIAAILRVGYYTFCGR